VNGLRERDALLDPKIVPARRASRATTAAEPEASAGEHLAEEILHVREHVAHARVVPAALEARVAELVVGLALLIVRQDLVGLVHFLEASLGLGVARVPIRVVLHGLFSVGLAQLVGAGAFRAAEHFVVVTLLGHGGSQRADEGAFTPYAAVGRKPEAFRLFRAR
jgi:hypothetical protein